MNEEGNLIIFFFQLNEKKRLNFFIRYELSCVLCTVHFKKLRTDGYLLIFKIAHRQSHF